MISPRANSGQNWLKFISSSRINGLVRIRCAERDVLGRAENRLKRIKSQLLYQLSYRGKSVRPIVRASEHLPRGDGTEGYSGRAQIEGKFFQPRFQTPNANARPIRRSPKGALGNRIS